VYDLSWASEKICNETQDLFPQRMIVSDAENDTKGILTILCTNI
jgi:hypothetical protein